MLAESSQRILQASREISARLRALGAARVSSGIHEGQAARSTRPADFFSFASANFPVISANEDLAITSYSPAVRTMIGREPRPLEDLLCFLSSAPMLSWDKKADRALSEQHYIDEVLIPTLLGLAGESHAVYDDHVQVDTARGSAHFSFSCVVQERYLGLQCTAIDITESIQLFREANNLPALWANTAHELKQPLNALKFDSASLALQIKSAQGLEKNLRNSLKDIVNRIGATIADYSIALDRLPKPDDIKPRTVPVRSLLAGLIEQFTSRYPNVTVDLTVDQRDSEYSQVVASPASIAISFSNLIDNARKAIERSGGKPVIEVELRAIEQREKTKGGSHRIFIDVINRVGGMSSSQLAEYNSMWHQTQLPAYAGGISGIRAAIVAGKTLPGGLLSFQSIETHDGTRASLSFIGYLEPGTRGISE